MRTIPHVKPLLFGLALALSSCNENDSHQRQAPTYPVIQIPVRTLTTYNSYPARIEGVVNSDIRAKVRGYIQKVLVDEGEHVRKGQPLFQLETQSLSQDAAAARAKVYSARVEVDKLVPLVEKNIVSEVQLETAKAHLESVKSSYNSIVADVAYAMIKSPVDGFVGAIPFRAGTLVGPGDRTPLTTVTDTHRVYVYFPMNETDYLNFLQNTEGKNLQEKIKNFPAVSLILPNGAAYGRKGEIQTATGQINPNTGALRFRAIFDNPGYLLTNGNSGIVKIPVTYRNMVVVTQSATYEQQGQIYVYKVSADHRAKATAVTVEARADNLYAISAGLKEGDKIVAEGTEKLREDALITPREVAFDSIAKPVEKLFK